MLRIKAFRIQEGMIVMAETERELVLEILTEVLEKGKFCQQVMDPVLGKYRLSRREKAFISRTSLGTVEKLITIDYVLNLYSTVKVEKMKPAVRNILRSAVYQILYMDQVPDSAACNEAVKLACAKGYSGLKGFVNGVLRTVVRERNHIPMPKEEEDAFQALSVLYAVPRWMVQHFTDNYGKEKAEEILRGLSEERPVTVRVNRSRAGVKQAESSLKREGVAVFRHPDCPDALVLEKLNGIQQTEAFERGWIQVQDAASILAVSAANIREGMKILDVCAAPGGKSICAADLAGSSGTVISRDISDRKIQFIYENKKRCGFDRIYPEVYDASVFDASKEGWADVVLADLPCSGLGILAKKPDIRHRVTKEDFSALEELQRKILKVVWRYVKPGGILLYSTCTINPGENEKMAEWFLTQKVPFRMEETHQWFPCRENDGFFMAKFRRNDEKWI